MLKERLKKKEKLNKGFTLVEMLCSVLILSLVSVGLVTGVKTGTEQFKKSMRISEAETLYTTLQAIISNELKYTNTYTLNKDNTVATFYSMTYAIKDNPTGLYVLDSKKDDDKVVTNKNDYGQLAMGDGLTFNRLLGKSSYMKDLGAKATITYNTAGEYFSVTLDIGLTTDRTSIVCKSFDVRALDHPTKDGGGKS